MDIKENLIKIREQRKFTKKYVAENSGVPYTSYTKYESGERKEVSLESLCKLADFYGVSLDTLAGREFPEQISADQYFKVNENFMQLPEDVRNALQILIGYFMTPEKTSENTAVSYWAVPPAEDSKAIASEDTDSLQLKEPPENEMSFEVIDESEV